MEHRLRRIALRITGVVQGVGYRPFAYAEAQDRGLTGFIGNDPSGVFIEAQGETADLESFQAALAQGPPLAVVEQVTVVELDVLTDDTAFTIVASEEGAGSTSIPPDTATCEDCLREMADPSDRRFRYPFIACTHCGPRYTIVTGLPYDRPFTTMAAFPLCASCEEEYADPRDRRFHAQPTACPDCGPRLRFTDGASECWGDEALAAALGAWEAGQIVAVKGVGGYHLACDARQPGAVARLRDRKQRGAKPFAVMVRDVDTAAGIVELDDVARSLLTSREAPIVLAQARDGVLRDAVAPGQARIGVMLPYAPVHHLAFAAHPQRPGGWVPEVLVMTSGNAADEPICIDAGEAEIRLAPMADAFLHHDRGIHVSCDDSVLAAGGQPVRRSRGYAPLPLHLPLPVAPTLAVGGELKTTLCVATAQRAWMSQHIGDTANLETLALLARTATTLSELVRVTPELIAADMHPGYLSRRWAEERARETGAQVFLVQHHHAHVASLMAEHGVPPDEPVLGFAFDGTGYGADGTIWGGEILLATYAEALRVGHLRPIGLPGGDAAIRRPARTALAHLFAADIPWSDGLPPFDHCDETERRVIGRMLLTGTGCTPTTSMGRLFDAVSSLLGVCQDVDYEGQAAIELEALASQGRTARRDGRAAPVGPSRSTWALAVTESEGVLQLDPGPVLGAAVAGLAAGVPAPAAAYSFHEALADAVAQAAAWARDRHGVSTVGLTGGVFANRLLEALCRERLGAIGVAVLTHRLVPSNDGGLALGQAVVAGSAT